MAGGAGVCVTTLAGSNVGVLGGTRACVAVGRSVRVEVRVGMSNVGGTGVSITGGLRVWVAAGGTGVRDRDGETVRLGGGAVIVAVGASETVEVIAGAAVGLARHAASKTAIQINPTCPFIKFLQG
jgi:hypothetical protein